MLKRILMLVAAVAIMVTFVGCDDKDKSKKPSDIKENNIFGETAADSGMGTQNTQTSIEKMYNPAPADAEEGKCGENATWRIENGTLFVEGSGATWDYSLDNSAPWSACSEEIDHITVGDEITIIGELAFGYLKNVGGIELGRKVSYIGNSAFYGIDELDEVYIPSSVKVIDDFAFKFCSNLEEIEFSEGLVEIGEGAFSLCYDLENVMLPNSVTSIKRDAFNGCSGLESVNLPMFIEKVGLYCFSNSGLEYITIPKSLKFIATGVFDGCNELEAVYYGGSEQDWADVQIESANEALSGANVYYNAR